MKKRRATVAFVCVAQVVAVGLGVAWGLGTAHRVRWLFGHWLLAGGFAVFLIGVEWLRRLVSRRVTVDKPAALWICLALGSHAAWLMVSEAFLWYTGDRDFYRGVLLMAPFLLAIGFLVRAGAWLGVLGSALFLATSLAMLIRNGCSRTGGSGFFGGWVS